jgi:hypothetical protein
LIGSIGKFKQNGLKKLRQSNKTMPQRVIKKVTEEVKYKFNDSDDKCNVTDDHEEITQHKRITPQIYGGGSFKITKASEN